MRAGVISLGALLFVSFLMLSKYEDRVFIRNLDFAVTVRLQERIDRSSHLRAAAVIGNLMEGATLFASPEFISITTILLTGLLLYDRKKKRWHIRALVIPLALTALVVIEIYGKSIVHHPAPMYSMIKNPTTIFPADYINEQFSYPSGHAARAVFLAITFLTYVYIKHRKQADMTAGYKHTALVAGSVCYVVLVAISRIYLGHHWLSDVIGGLLLGSSVAIGAAGIMKTRDV